MQRPDLMQSVPVMWLAAHRAGPDEVVDLVDEEHDIAARRLHLVQDAVHALLESPSVLGSSEQASDVEAD